MKKNYLFKIKELLRKNKYCEVWFSFYVYHQCLHDTFVACFCQNRERKSPTINKLVLRALFFC